MLKITQNLGQTDEPAQDTLTLPFELRRKGRFRAVSDAGTEVGLFLERGQVLAQGDRLKSECGQVFEVAASPEPMVTAHAADWPGFARACYHLGNRHVTLEIGPLWLRFPPDHVLEHLAEHLGLRLEHGEAPFNPESGAYQGLGGHHHHDDHGHHHDH
ncbi:urease accessory protein UreE [Zobellella denitrificans]|jgi:urease accessory protein|uniref:urease accessory protein UreE n=1 Tax=Zobellella denitrificans TaxID=347534 RepID=UPI000B8C4D76|nr:urease accessory protein UreE [Zobellella denitrificans]OXS14016.1 urease accessory protein UreE [Zobellella denitrificans]